MKRKKLYILGSILALFVIGGWYVFSHIFGVVNTLRDARLGLAGFESGNVKTDSTDMFYFRGGEGKKNVLLIHGFGMGGATTWFDPMVQLSDELNLIVPDLIWFGESTGNITPNLPNQARAIWTLCDSLKVKPDAIVGVSYGGFVAFEMLHQRPMGTEQLLIVNSPGPVFMPEDIAQLCERAEVKTPDELFIPKDVTGLQHLFKFVFSEDPPIPDFVYEQIFEKETKRNADIKRVLMQDLVNNADVYRVSGFPKTKNGIIWGRNDQVFPMECGERLSDSLNAEMVVLEQSGHVPNPRDREQFLAGLRKFLVD